MSDASGKIMVQFHFERDLPDVSAVAQRFGVAEEAIDPDFGVIVTDEIDQLATILVPADVADAINAQLGCTSRGKAEGSFSNPRIEPFGPPSSDEPDD